MQKADSTRRRLRNTSRELRAEMQTRIRPSWILEASIGIESWAGIDARADFERAAERHEARSHAERGNEEVVLSRSERRQLFWRSALAFPRGTWERGVSAEA